MTNLTLVSSYNNGSSQLEVISAWAASIEEASEGAHSISVFGAGELVSAFEAFDAVSSGITDLAFISSAAIAPRIAEIQLMGGRSRRV